MIIADIFGVSRRVGFQVGCEFEIENISNINFDYLASEGITLTEDSSLRGLGSKEFITPPITLSKAIDIHNKLYNQGKLIFHGPATSDRCSIHVHVNFSDLENDKVRQFILLYALFEPFFFRMVDATRQNNIYCVPLSFTSLNKYYPHKDIQIFVSKWSKYTAFNVLPLGDYGTIEFRHLQGTHDNVLFENWLTTIENLYNVNKLYTLDNNLLDSAFVLELFRKIFINPFLTNKEVLKIVENTYIDVKLALLDPSQEVVFERIKSNNVCVD